MNPKTHPLNHLKTQLKLDLIYILKVLIIVLNYQKILMPQATHGNVNQVMNNLEILVRKNLNLKRK